MRTSNTIFVGVYSIVLIASIWFGVNWMITRGLNSIFDDVAEFVFTLLYIVALMFSIFLHAKLRNNTSDSNKICAVITSINVISFVGLVLFAFNSSGDDGLVLVAWIFAVLVLWLGSLVSGVIALKSSNT